MIKRCFIGLYFLICIPYRVDAKIPEWLTDFGNYIEKNNNQYQLLLLFKPNEKFEDVKVEEIVREILKKFPMVKISFQDASFMKAQELSKFSSFSTPQIIIVIIIHLSNDTEYMSQLNKPIDFVSNISESKRRSRCLIVLPQEQKNFTYLKVLQDLWAKQFLDITILEIFKGKNNHNLVLLEEIPIVHQWNPFINGYNRFLYTSSLSWFPDKTLNLYGHKMKIGLFNNPPLLYLEYDDQGKVKSISGEYMELTGELSKAMNFNTVWISPKNENYWGDSKIPKENSTGYMFKIMHNEIQYIIFESGRYGTRNEQLFEWSTGTKFITTGIVVPILEDKSIQVITDVNKVNVLIIIVVYFLIWILSRMLKFDRSYWNLLNIFKLFLGLSTLWEPNKIAERIVLGIILLSSMIISSFIFTAFTKVNLTKNSELNLDTIKDVVSSTLHTVMRNFTYPYFYDNAHKYGKILLNKTEVVKDFQNCIDDLIKKKSCSFISRTDIIAGIIDRERNKLGKPVMKLVKEKLGTGVSGFIMERRSPYVERFDQILLRMIQAGLVNKWQHTRYNGSFIVHLDESGFTRGPESKLVEKQLMYILIFGYSLSVTVFIFEVLFHNWKIKLR